ncbi:peptide transporter family 1-like [Ctenocephalides felis]|uniref:peptide transporter family 1-like n=1 Tax=Ctenocephalides felis TaxID=7515 RepID=UPI000E6E31B9|nr:peptide transporter family 1-like [Ctenocephalides felis]
MEGQQRSSKMPKAAYFLIVTKSLTAFQVMVTNSVMKTFMVNKLEFTTGETTSIIRWRRSIIYWLYLFGSLIAENYPNKFHIVIVECVGAIAAVSLLAFISAPVVRHIGKELYFVRLAVTFVFLFAINTVVSAFEGNQFKLPEETDAFMKFFRYTYVIGNFVVVFGNFLGPFLKTHVTCLGEQDCYMLAFSVSLIAVFVILPVYLAGSKFFIITKPSRRIAQLIAGCMWYGFTHWLKERKSNPKPNWLDHAEPKYGAQLVLDIRTVLNMMMIFCCVPLYKGVSNMSQDEWLFQASRMDTQFGSYTFIIEHFELVNPLLAAVMLPLCQYVVDPLLVKFKLDRTFRKMIFGGMMVAIAFWISGFIETRIKMNLPELPNGEEVQVRIFNGFNCPVAIDASSIDPHTFVLSPRGMYTNKHVPSASYQSIAISMKGTCFAPTSKTINAEAGTSVSILLKNEDGQAVIVSYEERLKKSEAGEPIITVAGARLMDSVIIKDSKGVEVAMAPTPTFIAGESVIADGIRLKQVVVEKYELLLNGISIKKFDMYQGGVYLATISGNTADFYEITEPNVVHISWMLPQSILLIFGEIYFTLTLAQFTYTEAPGSCKVLVMALQLAMDSWGEMFVDTVLRIEGLDHDHKLYIEATCLAISMVIFGFVGKFFKPLATNNVLI